MWRCLGSSVDLSGSRTHLRWMPRAPARSLELHGETGTVARKKNIGAAQCGEPRRGLAVLSFGGIDMVSPQCGAFRHTAADANLLLNAALCLCRPRRDVGIVADTCFCGSEWAFWVLPHWGPCWTWCMQARRMDGVRGAPRVRGADM